MTARDAQIADGLLTAVCAAGLTADALSRHQPVAASVALALLAATPLLWRRRHPVRTMAVVVPALLLCAALVHPYNAATGVALVALYTVAVSGDRRRALWTGAAGAALLAAAAGVVEHSLFSGGGAIRALLAVGAVVLGDLVRARRELREATRARERQEQIEREAQARRRLAAERLQIARELHDTLAHALVAINVRAGVAAMLGDGRESLAALEEIKGVSGEALGDLRATLDVLRDGDAPAPTAPTLDLAALPALMQTARAAGLRTAADVKLDGVPVPAAVGRAGYRIVQESLTNVVRHARASQTTVAVSARGGQLHIEVVDDGEVSRHAPGDGHGIQGMLERATALGGSVSAGPLPGRGWRVAAVLPLAEPR